MRNREEKVEILIIIISSHVKAIINNEVFKLLLAITKIKYCVSGTMI